MRDQRQFLYAEAVGCAAKDCKIFVANFVLPDGNTSKYGMQLADALSKGNGRSAARSADG
jgi:hypothetical protein